MAGFDSAMNLLSGIKQTADWTKGKGRKSFDALLGGVTVPTIIPDIVYVYFIRMKGDGTLDTSGISLADNERVIKELDSAPDYVVVLPASKERGIEFLRCGNSGKTPDLSAKHGDSLVFNIYDEDDIELLKHRLNLLSAGLIYSKGELSTAMRPYYDWALKGGVTGSYATYMFLMDSITKLYIDRL